MTDVDKITFVEAFGRLAAAFRDKEPDVLTLCAYFDAFRDLEIEFVVAAADRLLKTAAWFPKTSEWRREATKVESERRQAQRALLAKLPEPLCAACGDTGWTAAAATTAERKMIVDRRVETLPTPGAPMRRCECVEQRRLELLGRRPSPMLTTFTLTQVNGDG